MKLVNLFRLQQELSDIYQCIVLPSDVELPDCIQECSDFGTEHKLLFNKYSFTATNKNGQSIFFPNQVVYIAAFFTRYYIELKKYYNVLSSIKLTEVEESACLGDENACLEVANRTNLEDEEKLLLVEFLKDKTWWKGGKSITRTNDYFYSPILSQAGLVAASQSFVAEISKFFADPQHTGLLNEVLSILDSFPRKQIVLESTSMIGFMADVMKYISAIDGGFTKLLPLFKANKVTVGVKGCSFGKTAESCISAATADQRRKDDYSDDVTFVYNNVKYFFYKEQTTDTFHVFKETINSIYKSCYISVENGKYRLYAFSFIGKTRTMEKFKNQSLQQIFYGAPGTGKSHKIEEETTGQEVIRTTFHPDSDYSTFVGAYKPTTVDVAIRDVTGKIIKENGEEVKESRVVYKFVPQAFLKAYVKAWQDLSKPMFLVIEEINRGNCAQIFGDIFQLLDRNEDGYSSYEIDPDMDIQSFLSKEFVKAVDASASDKIKSGEKMMLPPNLFIWATMNTSDQSLFPIDSAFKRRWDWIYMPIDEEKENWTISVNNKPYSWSSFLKKINKEIQDTTSSEDKMLGFYFCKADNGVITADRFVSKVLFYLYNDVFRDYGLDSREFFKDKENGSKVITFQNLYKNEGSIDEGQVEIILKNLDVEVIDLLATDEEDDNAGNMLSVELDGSIIQEKNNLETYVKTLELIGVDKIAALGIKQYDQFIVGTEPPKNYAWRTVNGYYVLTFKLHKYFEKILTEISNRLGLDLKIKFS